MQRDHINRRQATSLLVCTAGLAITGLANVATGASQLKKKDKDEKDEKKDNKPAARQPNPPAGSAPNPTTPPQGTAPASVRTTSPLDTFLKHGRERERTLRIDVIIDGYQTPVDRLNPKQMPETKSLRFDTAAIVFPVLLGTASSEMDLDRVKGVMSVNDKPADATPEFKEDYHSGTRLGKWTLRDVESRQASLALELPMRMWQTSFNEAAAKDFPWPAGNAWSKTAMSTFQPQLGAERTDPIFDQTIKQWTNGKDPKSIPPVQLAKFLTGKIAETLQPSDDSYIGNDRNGQFAGLVIKGAAKTLRDMRGNEHDIALATVALFRNAGLPARTVIGHDLESAGKGKSSGLGKSGGGSGPHLRSWVEFCLYDPASQTELWVPTDPVRVRGYSSRMQPLDKAWKYFATHDQLDEVMPFAFQYHPPTTVVAHGAVAFWGWLTMPETQPATQWLRFTSVSTPKGPSVEGKPRGR